MCEILKRIFVEFVEIKNNNEYIKILKHCILLNTHYITSEEYYILNDIGAV